MVKIIISLKNVCLFFLFFGILVFAVGVYAYGGTSPSFMGHTMGELAPPSGCTDGILMYSGWSWIWTSNTPVYCFAVDNKFLQYDLITRTLICSTY